MKITCLMVSIYILCCIRIATKPCKYFQLNAKFFDRKRGIFSKIDIDQLIPEEWRLAQRYDDDAYIPERFPVFVKPEWGQNAYGVHRADNVAELHRIRAQIRDARVRYLIQQGADEINEYEIFSIRHHLDSQRYAVFTITQACNPSEAHPLNSIYNENTRYIDITDLFSDAQCMQLWDLLRRIDAFNISRVSVRANSIDELLRGVFHVIEVNLFLPMPINLLDDRYSWSHVFAFVMPNMLRLARITKHRDKNVETKPVFMKSMLYNRSNNLINSIRARL